MSIPEKVVVAWLLLSLIVVLVWVRPGHEPPGKEG